MYPCPHRHCVLRQEHRGSARHEVRLPFTEEVACPVAVTQPGSCAISSTLIVFAPHPGSMTCSKAQSLWTESTFVSSTSSARWLLSPHCSAPVPCSSAAVTGSSQSDASCCTALRRPSRLQVAPPPAGPGLPGTRSVRLHDQGEYPLRRPLGHRRARRGGHQGGERARLHLDAHQRHRHVRRRARGAAVRRPEAAHRDRARDSQGPEDPTA